MNFDEALAYVSGLQGRGWRLGLDRMDAFIEAAGLRDAVSGAEAKYLHVAGTNGKGSVTAYIASLLQANGFRTGSYYSPFVYDPMERVQFQGQNIPRDVFSDAVTELQRVEGSFVNSDFGGVTEFEVKTAVGFWFWRKVKAEWVALETGLGGRLDATNVVNSEASVITSIGLDHTAILGNTRAKIAGEKAGIIKAGKPVTIGQMPNDASEVIAARAQLLGCPVNQYGVDVRFESEGSIITTPWGSYSGVELGITGEMQGHNAAIALCTVQSAGIQLTPEVVHQGIRAATIPGRFEQLSVGDQTWILDGAHNPDSAENLAKSLESRFGPDQRFILISNMVAGHSLAEFYSRIGQKIAQAVIPPIQFFRARTPSETAACLTGLGIQSNTAESIDSAVLQAFEQASRAGEPVLVTGSFYLLGELKPAIEKLIRRIGTQ